MYKILRISRSANFIGCKLKTVEFSGVKPTIDSRCLSTSNRLDRHYKLLVVGGGSGGCAVAAKFCRSNLDPNLVAVIEPADMHYYQPMWTLVGGGMKTLADSGRPMKDVLPPGINWIKDRVTTFEPNMNRVQLGDGQYIQYDYLVVALGIQLKYEQIKGLPEAFETPGVCSNYSPLYVDKTYEALRNFKKGNAIFTFPNSPVKCPGAPQKILYIAEDYFRRTGKLQDANMIYNTSLGVLFGVKHYADALWKVVKARNIQVNLRQNLIEVIPKDKKAVFQNLDKPEELKILPYEMLHVSPPQGPYDVIKSNTELADAAGFLSVKKTTLQHSKYENIFGLGDCTNSPNSKTAAAVAAQSWVLYQNLWSVMNNREPTMTYDGYASCPLVTSNKKCILAEFDYNLQPLETFPIDQSKELRSMFLLKKHFMPFLYWNVMLKGLWNGPGTMRSLMHLGMK